MDVKIKNKTITVTHKLKRDETFRIQRGTKFQSVTFLKKPQVVSGFSNMCTDLKGILCIDYDNVDLSVVLEDYKGLQERFLIGQAHLFATRAGNYHVICLEKFWPSKIYEMLLYTRCDENYKSMPLRTPYRSWVLRISGKKGSNKPKFIRTIGTKLSKFEIETQKKETSQAHFNLLKRLYPDVQFEKPTNLDKLSEVKLQAYETTDA